METLVELTEMETDHVVDAGVGVGVGVGVAPHDVEDSQPCIPSQL